MQVYERTQWHSTVQTVCSGQVLTFTVLAISLQLVAWLALAPVVVFSDLNALLFTAPIVDSAGIDS